MLVFILGGALMLGICIFIHELGHYIFGRLVGIKAEVFSIGYGKGVWKKKIGDTTWQITAIPFGGYVKFYGHESPDDKTPGSFFSAPPLRRIIPVLGGPIFNLILGFFILFILHNISGPLAPRVTLVEEPHYSSAARRAKLQNEDLIKSINGKPIHSFMEMTQVIALSGGKPLDFEIQRGEKTFQKTIVPEVLPSGINTIGMRMPGERYLKVNYSTLDLWAYRFRSLLGNDRLPRNLRALSYLKNGDIILTVEDQKIRSAHELQNILGRYHNKTVTVKVLRQKFPWLSPWPKYEKTVEVPIYPEYVVRVANLVDRKYGQSIQNQALYSIISEHQRGLNFISINGKSPGSFQNLAKLYRKPQKVSLRIGQRNFTAVIQTNKIGLMGFTPNTIVYGDYLDSHPSRSIAFRESVRDLTNNIMVYPTFFQRLFSGRMSFMDNAAGPLRIFGTAGIILESGFQNYLHFFAAISIALCIMNLLPFPVVDGGHVVFFLYEAIIGKPISLRFRENLHRIGLSILLFFGIWIMYRDLLWLLGI